MNTLFATSSDGTRIAYDVSGAGAPLILLHGGGTNRQTWHDVGYVERLRSNFQVITIDLRGHGASDKPATRAAYTTDKMCRDILAVADGCGVDRFTLWGFSYGANLSRYLAAHSPRVAQVIIIGVPFGPGASGDFRQFIQEFSAHWVPLLDAQSASTLDVKTLSQEDQAALASGNLAVAVAWLSAMLDWASIEPEDLHVPALWLVGSNDKDALASTRTYEPSLGQTPVQLQIVEGLDHRQEFNEIDKVLPIILAFAKRQILDQTNG